MDEYLSRVREIQLLWPREKIPGQEECSLLTEVIYSYYAVHRRDLPWRHNPTPWQVYVSEIMLQQTQVPRVIEKYPPFMKAFPDPSACSSAPFEEVLRLWKGLGYNRRAKSLHTAASIMVERFNAGVPEHPEDLMTLPGIGTATAASIAAFAFNAPTVFIETNIRTVFIHFFFHHRDDVHDREILPLVNLALDRENPAEWYSAVMDFGTMLKKHHPNPSRKSVHHGRQAPFAGSKREIRGKILDILLTRGSVEKMVLVSEFSESPHDSVTILDELAREGLVHFRGSEVSLD